MEELHNKNNEVEQRNMEDAFDVLAGYSTDLDHTEDIGISEEEKKQSIIEAECADKKSDDSADCHVFYAIKLVYNDKRIVDIAGIEKTDDIKTFNKKTVKDNGIVIRTVVFSSEDDFNEYKEIIKQVVDRNKKEGTNNSTGEKTGGIPKGGISDEGIADVDGNDSSEENDDFFGGGVSAAFAADNKEEQPENENSSSQNATEPKKANKTYSLKKYFKWIAVVVTLFVLWHIGVFDFVSPKGTQVNNTSQQTNKSNIAPAQPDPKAKEQQTQGEQNSSSNTVNGNSNNTGENTTGMQTVENTDNKNMSKGTQQQTQNQSSEGGTNDPANDPVYQQRQALRQQYLELIKQSFLSPPNVGSWAATQTQSQQNQAATANKAENAPFAELNNAIQKAKQEAQNAVALTDLRGTQSDPGGNTAASSNSKQAFFDSTSSGRGYLRNTRTEKISPYALPAGTMIPAALISGINSDLPGNITASVTENVYDWQSAHVCLIPQGSRLFGTYSSAVSFGQKRLQVSWQRLIFPDGTTLSLEGMSGVDRRGYSGLKDKTYNHYTKMIVAAAMTTAFTIIPALVENQRNDNSVSYGNSARDTAASQAAQALGYMGNKFFDKSLNVQPTLLIRPGKRFNVQVNADIPFYRAWRIQR